MVRNAAARNNESKRPDQDLDFLIVITIHYKKYFAKQYGIHRSFELQDMTTIYAPFDTTCYTEFTI